MSLLLDIQQQLGIANARVAALELALVSNPNLPSVAANLATAVRVQQTLIKQFDQAAAEAGYDILRYRAFDEDNSHKAAGAFQAVADFQTLFSVVHSAIKMGGGKMKAVYNDEIARQTTFGFGYAMAGSVEIVLTATNRQLLFGAELDQTVDTVFDLAMIETAEELEKKARWLGPGPINALYEWTEDNLKHGLGASLTWKHGEQVARSVTLQRQHIRRLWQTIGERSSEITTPVTLTGLLSMADVDIGRFKLRVPHMKAIRGTVEPNAITEHQKAELPRMYKAYLKKTVRTHFRRGEQKVKWHLVRLEPVEGASNEQAE